MANAAADGLIALQAIGDRSPSPAGSHDDEEMLAPAPGLASPKEASAHAPTDELLALAMSADETVGPLLVYALASSRDQVQLSRAYVKYLEVHDPTMGDAHRMVAMGDVWTSTAGDKRAEFTRLCLLLLKELSHEDDELDPDDGTFSEQRLVTAIRELMLLCERPQPQPAGPADGPMSAITMATAIGSAMAAALPLAGVGGAKDAAKTKMSARRLSEVLTAFSARNGGEVEVTAVHVPNRTLMGALYESLVTCGQWPIDVALSVDRMAPQADALGFQSSTDTEVMELNPATGKYENAARDPVAADASKTVEYLTKLRLLLTGAAVLLHGITCDSAPHLVAGRAGKQFLQFSSCLKFDSQASEMRGWPLVQVRFIVSLTLRDVGLLINALNATRMRAHDALLQGTKSLKAKMEQVVLSSFGSPQAAPWLATGGEEPSHDAAPPAPAAGSVLWGGRRRSLPRSRRPWPPRAQAAAIGLARCASCPRRPRRRARKGRSAIWRAAPPPPSTTGPS